MEFPEREKIMKKFRTKCEKNRILVTTNVLSRFIEMEKVGL